MLTIQLLRENKELVIEGLTKKNFKNIDIIDTILALDGERRKLQNDNDGLASQLNSLAKQIGQLMSQGKKEEAEETKANVAAIKSQQKEIADQLAIIEKQQHDAIISLPNLPHASVPVGKTPEENEIVKTSENIPSLPNEALPHWELTTKYNLIDFELGVKVTGAGFPIYKGKAAKLQRALINYFLDYNTAAGYVEHEVPILVNEDSAYGTGQLPDKEGQMYHVTGDNMYLIPTAEVPLTNMFRDNIINAAELPIKVTGYTPCFRREAGSYGKDVRGLNRLHQFDKVEIVQIVEPSESYNVLEDMVLHVEKLLQQLELPYRILRLCGGDMSFTSALTYDFEVWSAAQQRWLEVSSVSNFESFQTNRMKIRYKDKDNKTQLLHSLNGSSLALPRIVACILENNQTPEGINIPKVLQPYMNMQVIN